MKRLVAGLWLALFAITIVAVHLWRELRTEREQTTELDARVVALEPAQGVQPGVASSLETVSSASTAQAALGADAPPVSGNPPASGANALAAGIQQSMNTPAGREYTRTMTRMTLEQRYPDLAQALNLSPEEAEKLLDLLVNHTTDQGTDRANLQSGVTRDRAARQELARQLAEREQTHEAELAALLGSNHAKWKEYERMAAVRQQEAYASQQVDQLRNAVSPSRDPLGDAQFQTLNTALAAEKKRIDQDSRGLSLQQQVQRMSETNQRLVDVAAVHLNPGQLDGYRRYLEQQHALMRTMVIALDEGEGAQGPASAGNP